MTTQLTNQKPWQQPQPSAGLKLLITLGTVVLLIIAIVTLFMVLVLGASFVNGQGSANTATSNVIPFAVALVLLIASGFGLVKLFPLVRAPTNFTPSYALVAAEVAGHPFDIRFRQAGWSRRMDGKGTARFDADVLVVAGWLTPHSLVQIAVVLVVTVTPIMLFGVGLGLIPALIIAYYLGRKKVTLSIPYSGIRDLKMKGCTASFVIPMTPPSKLSFATAQVDGERLYREMQVHVPAAPPVAVPFTVA